MAGIAQMNKLTKWLPSIAVVGAGYNYYNVRGWDGLISDLKAITFEGVKAKASQIAMGAGLVLLAKPASNYVPNSTLKPVVRAAMYYMGATQLFDALAQGAAMGGSRSGAVAAGRGRGYRYMPPASNGINAYRGAE